MKYKVGIIGRFAFGKELLNGQTIKTRILTETIQSSLPEENMSLVDTYGGVKAFFRLPFQCIGAVFKCKNLVILPAYKGLRIIAPFLTLLNIVFHRKLHYVVIGGWLNNLLEGKYFLTWCLKQFDWIYVETSSMKKKLEEQGFKNVVQMPNFKQLPVLEEVELPICNGQEFRLCIFSRVMKEKGIEIAVDAINTINKKMGKTVFSLDIYGQIDIYQTQWFDDLCSTFPCNIRYCGEVAYDKSVETLKYYDVLLFPTQYYTEGIPGTIIDAYAAGLPVIASIWENYSDIIDEGTGIGYPFNDPRGLESSLMNLAMNPEALPLMKRNCLKKAQQYSAKNVIGILLENFS